MRKAIERFGYLWKGRVGFLGKLEVVVEDEIQVSNFPSL
jgi:hypothetical protein